VPELFSGDLSSIGVWKMIKSCFIIEQGPSERKVFPIFTRVTIGRAPSNDISLPDRAVSKRHAVVGRVKGQTIVKDLGSQNGTFLNERRIDRAVLASGDKLRIGEVTLRFFQEDLSPRTGTDDGGTAPRPKKRLGEYMVEAGIIDEQTLREALDKQERNRRLGETLIHMGVASDEDVARALARQLNIPFMHIKDLDIPKEVVCLVPAALAETNLLMPVELTEGKLLVAMVNPLDTYALQVLRVVTKMSFKLAVTPREDMLEAFSRYYPMEYLKMMLDADSRADDVVEVM
jgi:hypothetical protein